MRSSACCLCEDPPPIWALNGFFEGFIMVRNRTLATRTLVCLFFLAATACSGTDATSPQADSPALSTVADRLSLSQFTGTITIIPATATIAAGGTLTLNGIVKSLTGVDLTSILGPQATLTSSDTTIATVSDLGVVTGIRPGVVTITAQLGLITGTSTITVGTGTPTASSSMVITLLPGTATLAVGSSLALNGSVNQADGTDVTATVGPEGRLTSSDPSIATVSPRGIVTGIRSGVVTITAQIGTVSTTSTITVVDPTSVVTPPSLPSGPGSGSTSGSGSSLSGIALVSDDYSQYGNTVDLLANVSVNVGGTGSTQTALYNDGGNAQLVTLDKSVTYNGHATMKYSQPGGTAETPELWVDFPHTMTHIWLRTKIRFSPGFTTNGTLSSSANAYKLLGFGFSNYDGSGRLEITNTNQYQIYWNAQSKSGGALVGGGNFGQAGDVTTEWSDGGWYEYILEVDFSQSTTGVTRIWMARDGQTPVLKATSSSTMHGGLAMPAINGIMLGMNFNQTRAAFQSQALWWGEWEVVDGTQYSNPFRVSGV